MNTTLGLLTKGLTMLAASCFVAATCNAQEVSSGQSRNLDYYSQPSATSLPPGKTTANIRGMAIAASTDRTYTWYDDNTVSSGTSWNLDAYQSPQPVSPFPGYMLDQLAAVAIANNDHVFYYWLNGTVTQGTSTAPLTYALPLGVNYPEGKSARDLRGVGVAGSSGQFYAWFADGTVSRGLSTDLNHYADPLSYSLGGSYEANDLAGVAIAASSDHAYAWYHSESIGDGYSTIESQIDQAVMNFLEANNIAGATVAVSKRGNIVFDKGFGVADVDTGVRMEPYHRSRVGSVSKIVTTLGLMKYAENQDPAGLSLLDEPLYGLGGLLPSIQFILDQSQGRARNTPVVGTVIRKSDDRVLTYYDNETVSIGTSWDLDSLSPALSFSLPANQEARDIRGMAADDDGNIFTWYRDGSLSAGTEYDLAATYYLDTDSEGVSGVQVAEGQSFDYLVGMGISSADLVYSWYQDGTRSVGNVLNLGQQDQGLAYTPVAGKTSYDIRSMAIASNDRVYTFYGNNTVSSGTSWELDRYSGPYATSIAAGITAMPFSTWYGAMTPRHLVTHTAGFFGGGDTRGTERMFNLDEEDLTYTQVHRYMLRTRPLRFAPGSDDLYSNHGLGLTGYLLEQLTGLFYPDWTQTNILTPLGLTFGRSWDPLGPLDASPHQVDASGNPYRCDCVSSSLSTQAGGWTASAGDLVRLMLATDRHPERPDILLPATLDVMESAPFPAAQYRAHGWKRTNKGKLSHGGSTGGGRASIVKFTDGYIANDGTDLSEIYVALALNTNTSGINLGALSDEIVLITGTNWVSPSYDLY